MSAGIYNIIIEQHSDFERTFQIKENSVVLDITDHTFTAQVRERAQSSTSVAMTGAIVTASDGKFKLSLTDTQTGAMKAGDYEYDCVMTDAGGKKTRLLQGIATVDAGITR